MMTNYYTSWFINGVIKFAEYFKENSCSYGLDNDCSFEAIDSNSLNDLVEKFLDKKEFI